jgi:YidC/Oxa1 family membrane protein insertase
MVALFNFFGNIMGYLLWFLYCIFKNYGVAIILFTLVVKVVLFPTSITQQKNMAKQAKLAEKQKELQKKCGNDREKYNEELQKLYEKENMSPYSGCLVTLLPFPIMLGIYYSVIYPLSNTLHIASDAIEKATNYVSMIPGISSSTSTGNYIQLIIVKNWSVLKEYISGFFSDGDIAKIESFEKGFKVFGIDLLGTPKGSAVSDLLWLIPLLCVLSYWLSTFYMQRASGQKGQGCMNASLYMMPLLSAYWAYIMPAAVGFYWIVSSLLGFVQTVIVQNFFSVNHVEAMSEAQHFVTMQNADMALKPLSADQQAQIAAKIEAQNNQIQDTAQKNKSNSKKKSKSNNAPKNNSNDYIGSGK